jgi:septal ring factor EnvC (AmiA/AmiB activator)
MQTVLNFLKENYKTIIKVAFGLFILYYLIFFLTPRVKMAAEERAKIDLLNKSIEEIYKHQQKLDSNIQSYNKKIDEVDDHIDNIKGQKIIIKEIYHEKINSVDKLTTPELDSFFSNRYN